MSKPSNFRDLKTSFETRSKATTATTPTTPYRYRSVAGDLANMPSDQPTKVVPSIAHSIDAVLDTQPAAKHPVRPTAKLRPSWIGPPRPERPTTPGVAAMKQHVSVEYSSPGLQPPVYIFTNLSDPQWEAVEMHTERKTHGGHRFSMAFDVEEGEYQYKFRLGPGDWWACDESKPTVDDGSGNKNNLLVVKLQQSKSAEDFPDRGAALSPIAPGPPAVLQSQAALQMHTVVTPAPHKDSAPKPLMKHETFVPNTGSEAQQTPEREAKDPIASEQDPGDADPQPLMKHETFAPKANAGYDSTSVDNGEDSSSSEDEDGLRESNRSPLLRHESVVPSSKEQTHAPLLRHESVVPSSKEQTHAPLFCHESIALGYNHHEAPATTMSPVKHSRNTSSSSLVPDEADPNDPSLEKFPTGHAGIIDLIHRTSMTLAEDETSDDFGSGSPSPRSLSERSMSVRSLPSVREADEEELEKIRGAEEEEFEKEEASGEEMDPLRPAAPPTPPLTPTEPEDADFEPKIQEAEIIKIEERIVIEVVEERKNVLETLLEKLGGKGNAIALAVGLLVVAASITTMNLL